MHERLCFTHTRTHTHTHTLTHSLTDVPVSDSLPGVEDSISTGRAWTDKVVSGITEEDLYSDTQLHHVS